MSGFNKDARVSARVHISDKEKLRKNGYNVRQAIEYFNSVALNKLDSLNIDEFFLKKEIDDLKYQLIVKEKQLEDIQVQKDLLYKDNLSSLRVDSYQKIIGLFNQVNSNESFEEFITGSYVKQMIDEEVTHFSGVGVDDYCSDLISYYNNVILCCHTF